MAMATTALQFGGGHRKGEGAHPKAESCGQATWKGTCALLLLPRPRSRGDGEQVFTFRVFRKGKSGNRWPLRFLSICRVPGVTDRCGFCNPPRGIIIPDFIKDTLGAQVAKP